MIGIPITDRTKVSVQKMVCYHNPIFWYHECICMDAFQKMLYDCYNQPQPTTAASIPDIQNKLAINTINYW